MCPENASVVVIEDDPDARDTAIEAIQEAGHNVVGEYPNLRVVKEACDNGSFFSLPVQVVVADATMDGKWALGAPAIRAIKESAQRLGITTPYFIGNSADKVVEGADINNVGKDLSALPKLVTAAPDVLK